MDICRRDVGGGEGGLVGGEDQGVEPIFELAAAGLADFCDFFAVGCLANTYRRIAAGGENMFSVAGKGQIGRAALMARNRSQQFAGSHIE